MQRPPDRAGQGHLGGEGLQDPEAARPRTLKLKFSKGEVKKLRKAKRKQMKGHGDDQGDRVERRPPRP